MNRHYAKQGEVPRLGEIWRPIGDKTTVFALYLVDVESVRALVPRQLEIVSVWPGKTLGSLLLSYYGPQSTLEYHELGFMPARVRFAGCSGFWVTHLYVDNEKSVLGGRMMGYPKELAHFDWEGGRPGSAVISQEGRTLCRVRYGKPIGSLRFFMGGASMSILDDKVMWMRSRLKASYGLSRVTLDIPADSPMAGIRFSRPIVSIAGTDMAGFMAEDLRVLGFLPQRRDARSTWFTEDLDSSDATKLVPLPIVFQATCLERRWMPTGRVPLLCLQKAFQTGD